MPLHTRFRYTPSGDAHLGHAALCWLSYHAARVTGGTFTYRAETLRSLHYARTAWSQVREYWRRNFDDLCALGFEPTPGRLLAVLPECSANMAFEPFDDKPLVDYYWLKLGLRDIYGNWPPPADPPKNPEDGVSCWQSRILGNYEQGLLHPYCMLAMVVGDVTTGRNCLIRGDDLQEEAVAYNMLAVAVANDHYGLDEPDRVGHYVPMQHYIPKIRRTGTRLPEELRQPGGVMLSASAEPATGGMYLRDAIKAGVEPYQFGKYIGKVLFGSVEASDCVHTDWLKAPTGAPQSPVFSSAIEALLAKIVPAPMVDDEDWFRFLRTGEAEA